MTIFLISFGTVTLVAAIIWFIYVFFKENILYYLGFNGIRRRVFRHKLRNRNYLGEKSEKSTYLGKSKKETELLSGSTDETMLLNNSGDETVLLNKEDETTLL